jgi:nitric oxide reductase large subunit
VLRKLGLAVSYVITTCYIFSILMPSFYCLSHGCKGSEIDAFMPAFLLTPIGAIATAFSLHDAIQRIRMKQLRLVFWPLAILFSTMLLGVIALVGFVVYHTAFRR